jgi:hypothetical protein
VPDGVFQIVRDQRGSLVHVRRRDNGECVGCIEVGLYEVVASIILAETMATMTVTVEAVDAMKTTASGDRLGGRCGG